MSTCQIFDLTTKAICTKPDAEIATARCGHGHTSTKRACIDHARALRTGYIACRACADAGHRCDMTLDIGLPTWAEMSDLDKGAAIVYLSAADSQGHAYARKHYPARYLDHPALTVLTPDAAADHAEALFDDGIGDIYDQLGGEEADRLYDLADARLSSR